MMPSDKKERGRPHSRRKTLILSGKNIDHTGMPEISKWKKPSFPSQGGSLPLEPIRSNDLSLTDAVLTSSSKHAAGRNATHPVQKSYNEHHCTTPRDMDSLLTIPC
jgi:hypothetical protein